MFCCNEGQRSLIWEDIEESLMTKQQFRILIVLNWLLTIYYLPITPSCQNKKLNSSVWSSIC